MLTACLHNFPFFQFQIFMLKTLVLRLYTNKLNLYQYNDLNPQNTWLKVWCLLIHIFQFYVVYCISKELWLWNIISEMFLIQIVAINTNYHYQESENSFWPANSFLSAPFHSTFFVIKWLRHCFTIPKTALKKEMLRKENGANWKGKHGSFM